MLDYGQGKGTGLSSRYGISAADGLRWPRPIYRWVFDNMREVNGFFLFELGQMALLTALPVDVDLTPSLETIVENRKNARNFAEAKENKEDLPACVDVAVEFTALLDSIIECKPFPSISNPQKMRLFYLVMTFRDRLAAGLGRVYSYVLEEKDGRSVKTLWTKPLSLISSSILTNLSDFTTENIEEAAKSWVVDRPTAVGFHMMRSVECVLRVYARLVSGKNSEWRDRDGTLRYDGFGKLTDRLDGELTALKTQKSSFGQLELIVGILRPLGKLYRDPLSHPELDKLEEDDAKLAFEQGLAAIARMVQDAIGCGTHFKIPFGSGVQF